MIEPALIKTENKERDAKLLELISEGKTYLAAGRTVGLSKTRVVDIVRKNRSLLVDYDRDFEKWHRVRKLKSWVGDRKSKKDPADLLRQIQDELEPRNTTPQVQVNLLQMFADAQPITQQKDTTDNKCYVIDDVSPNPPLHSTHNNNQSTSGNDDTQSGVDLPPSQGSS